jgi:hypothetical protein
MNITINYVHHNIFYCHHYHIYCNFREKLGQDELEAKKKEKMGLDDSLAEIRVVFFLILFQLYYFKFKQNLLDDDACKIRVGECYMQV